MLKQADFITNATLYFGIGFDEMHREKAIKKNWAPFEVCMPLIEKYIDIDGVLRKHNIRQPELYTKGFVHNNCNGRCVKAGQGHYRNFKKEDPAGFLKLMEQEHYIKLYVSSYRYLKDMELNESDGFDEEVRDRLLRQLDDSYRDYFYDQAVKPRLFVHPAATAEAQFAQIKQYSFMKRANPLYKEAERSGATKNELEQIDRSVPFPLRDFHCLEESKPQQIDIFDIGGCGCFVS